MTTTAADRFAVAAALREIALLLEVKGGNPYRARACQRGAAAVEALAGDVGSLVAEERLTQVPGIGSALAAQIAELHRTGRSSMLERLRAELPPGILDLIQVPNLSVERIAALHRALGVRSLAELKAAAEAGRVRDVKGFGEKTEKKILDGIAELEARGQTLLLHEALAAGAVLQAWLYAHESATYYSVFGDFFGLKQNNRVILWRAGGLPTKSDISGNADRLETKLAPLGVDKTWLLPQVEIEHGWPPATRPQ